MLLNHSSSQDSSEITSMHELPSQKTVLDRVTVAYGDGIGPEIMKATLAILKAAEVGLQFDTIEIGENVYKKGISSGIPTDAWEVLRRNKVFLKAPITTPQGGGYKSLNVTIRKTLGLFANVRPCTSYVPFVRSHFPNTHLTIIRENEEDLYAGIEHRQTTEVAQCLKLITRPGCESIIRYAFEYARAHKRNRVTCMTKDNIMKHTDGLFHQVFREIAPQYPEIEADHQIIDIGAARVASNPQSFDVIVTLNLYGDILSDIAAQITGSVGLSGSANIGPDFAMFEAIHGSAPDIAGQNIANPSGLLHAACMMLNHLGKTDKAALIQNAWLRTIEKGIHTSDIYRPNISTLRANTQMFAEAVISNLGKKPNELEPISPPENPIQIKIKNQPSPKVAKSLVGVDIFLDWSKHRRDPNKLGQMLEALSDKNLQLKMITNRGVKVYPNGLPETFCTDHWRCRFVSRESILSEFNQQMVLSEPVTQEDIIELLQNLNKAGLEVIKTENLYLIQGKRAYSLGQGE